MNKVVTRFAPSPTGYLHVGGARTALFNWLLARHTGGQFLLRIEDTDLARSTEEACRQLLDDLRWLGLHWDNSQLVYQSKRLELYNGVIADLMKRDLAYEAWETQEELAARRLEMEKHRKQFIYRRPQYTSDQISRFKAEGRSPVIRFAMPIKEYRFFDVVVGKEIAMPAEESQDLVIRKTDGMPTYHFAVVVDDAAMNITHVLRGQEHLKNTFSHLALQESLGYSRPVYAHLSTIQNPDGTKMGKRDRDKKIRERLKVYMNSTKSPLESIASASSIEISRLSEWLADSKKQLDIDEQVRVAPVIGLKKGDLPEILIHDFRENGYLPDVLLNFLALLGWSPGGDREHMSIDEMTQLFTLERCSPANPKFDRAKLLAFNTDACTSTPGEKLLPHFKSFLAATPTSPLQSASDAQLLALLQMKKGYRTLGEVEELTRFFFIPDDQVSYDPDAVEKILRKNDGQGAFVLKEIQPVLQDTQNWVPTALESAVNTYCEQKQLPLGKVAQPLRLAISGTTVSPPIFESIGFLGRSKTLARVERCLSNL